MKKLVITFLSIMIISIIGFCVAFVCTGFNFDVFPDVFYASADDDFTQEIKTIDNLQDLEGIKVSTDHERIIFKNHNDDNIVITYFVSEYKTTEVTEGSEIKIISNRNWKNNIFRPTYTSDKVNYMQINIPLSFNGYIDVYASSGEISVTAKNVFEWVKLINSSGRVKADGITSGSTVEIKNTSGSINIKNCDFELGDLTVKNSSGSIEISDSKLSDADISQSSGSIRVYRTAAKKLNLENSSGNILISDATADKLTMRNTSGSVIIKSAKAESIVAKNSSGRIEADGEFDKAEFNVKSGKIELDVACPHITATNSSGKIEIKVSGKASDYKMDVSTSSGSVRVDGNKVKSGTTLNPTAENYIYAHNVSGSITINFY